MKRTVAIFFLVVIATGCTREWFLAVQPFGGGKIELCFSRSTGCLGDGVQFTALQISRVNQEGQTLEVVWLIQGHSNTPSDYVLKRVVYGNTPPGWIQVHPPTPIVDNTYYSVGGEFYFERAAEGDFHVYPREEFFSQIVGRRK
jgi:hypothetical protein